MSGRLLPTKSWPDLGSGKRIARETARTLNAKHTYLKNCVEDRVNGLNIEIQVGGIIEGGRRILHEDGNPNEISVPRRILDRAIPSANSQVRGEVSG